MTDDPKTNFRSQPGYDPERELPLDRDRGWQVLSRTAISVPALIVRHDDGRTAPLMEAVLWGEAESREGSGEWLALSETDRAIIRAWHARTSRLIARGVTLWKAGERFEG